MRYSHELGAICPNNNCCFGPNYEPDGLGADACGFGSRKHPTGAISIEPRTPQNEQAGCRCARVPPHQLPVRLAAFVQKRGRAAGAPECRRSSLAAHELGGCRRLSQKAPQFTPTMALMWVRPPPLNSGGSNFEVGSRNLNSFESLNSGAFNSGASELGRFLYAIPPEAQALDKALFHTLFTIVQGTYLDLITDITGEHARYTFAIVAMWRHGELGSSRLGAESPPGAPKKL